MTLRKVLLLTFSLTLFGYVHAGWPEASSTNKPWTRWWWHGSAVEKSELTRELESFSKAGIGGVEITPIYGVQGLEELETEFLSTEWLSLIEHACLEAKRLGMQVDIVPGTGWRLGHEFVPEEERAVKLKLEILETNGKKTYQPIAELSGERVKRPAPGGAGYTIDMLDHDAVQHYMDWFNGPFFKAISPDLIRCIFHDSWEYNTDWSHDFVVEFRERRGVDVMEALHIFDPKNRRDSDDTIERWRYEYRQTLEELLLENFCGTWNNSAHKRGLLSRNQGHGSIANLLDVYAMADIPETEIFRDFETFLVHKFASSAAHVSGKQLVSSESYTWLSEHWKSDLAKIKHFTDYLFLCGVNHIFFHGTAYSPEEASWPGWVFYASTQMNDRNPIWNHLPALNAYIQRCQSLLQSGESYAEAYLYWPIADLYSEKPGTKLRLHISGHDWFEGSEFERAAQQLWNKGVHFDYISDRQLLDRAQSDEGAPTVLLPPLKRMPLETLQALNLLAQQGVKVFAMNSPVSWKVPNAINTEILQKRLDKLLASMIREKKIQFIDDLQKLQLTADDWQSNSSFRSIRRIMDDGSDLYFITNRGDETETLRIPLEGKAADCERLNPWNGQIGKVTLSNSGVLELTLKPDESTFIRVGGSVSKSLFTDNLWDSGQGEVRELDNKWSLTFKSGGPELPDPVQLEKLDWITKLGESGFDRIAGLLKYETRFRVRKEDNLDGFLIDLGDLSSSAQVFINGELIGTSIRAPHLLRIPSGVLKSGKNKLVVEIATLADNRIRHLDRTGTPWRIFKDINLVSIEYDSFDASDWTVSNYGLKGPVRLLLKN